MDQPNQPHVQFDSDIAQIEPLNKDVEINKQDMERKTSRNKCLMFSAILCCKSLGLVNYICDVASDILNGYKYLRNQQEWPKLLNNSSYNYTRELCDNWESYRHVKMGTLTLSIVFIPSALAVLFLGTVYLSRNISTKFRDAHDKMRLNMGLTAENSKLVRVTNWVETGTCTIKTLKALLLFIVLCLFFLTWQLIVIYILLSELYYLYTLSEYRKNKNATREPLKSENGSKKTYKRRQSEIKIDLNKKFFQSSSHLMRISEMGTESILMLIVQLYIAIYSDYTPYFLQLFTMATSFMSLVLGTFYWNSEFPWDRKYTDGSKAIPLYMLSISYKCLSITTMIGVMKYYCLIPIFVLVIILSVIYYRLISDNTTKNVVNVGSVYLSLVTQNTLYHRRDIFQADDAKYLKWFATEALVSSVFHAIIMLVFCTLSTNDGHQLFINLNDCAKNSLQHKFPYICIGVALVAIMHLILTLLYVSYFPHVWKLDPTRRCEKEDEAKDDLEINHLQPSTLHALMNEQ